MKLQIHRSKNSTFHIYPQQTQPQPVYLSLDERGNVSIDWDGEIGNAVPVYVWHGRTRRWKLNGPVSRKTANRIMGDLKPQLRRILFGLSVDWNGSNNVGTLNEDAKLASSEIEEYLSGVEADSPEYFRYCRDNF